MIEPRQASLETIGQLHQIMKIKSWVEGSSTVKMEAAASSETLIPPTRLHKLSQKTRILSLWEPQTCFCIVFSSTSADFKPYFWGAFKLLCMCHKLFVFHRKKVQDFYQRTSLTAYCTAFAYRPLTRGVSSHLSQVYLELPADSKHLYVPHRSPTPLAWDFRSVLDPHCRGMLGHFHSTGICSC
jgi:hypothetical protein